jgi:hypothetical protein
MQDMGVNTDEINNFVKVRYTIFPRTVPGGHAGHGGQH